MTSPSRRNRRITAWSTAIAISLSGAALFAQSPNSPAPTNWQPYVPASAAPKPAPTIPAPAPNVEPPPLPPPITVPKPVLPKIEAKPLPVLKPREAAPPAPPPLPLKDVVLPPPPITKAPAPAAAAPAAAASSLPPALTEMPVIPAAAPPPVQARPAILIRPQTPTQAPVQTPPPAPAPVAPQPPTPEAERAKLDTLPPVTMPTKTELFRLETDAVIDARIFKELNRPVEALPSSPPLVPPGTKYEPKTSKYEPFEVLREPSYVIHRRLYFEEMNSERAGWDSGPSQNLFSGLYFFRDVLLVPSKFASGCKSCYDCSAGKCMPGNPTPYYCYPLSADITPFGGTLGAGAIIGLIWIFP